MLPQSELRICAVRDQYSESRHRLLLSCALACNDRAATAFQARSPSRLV